MFNYRLTPILDYSIPGSGSGAGVTKKWFFPIFYKIVDVKNTKKDCKVHAVFENGWHVCYFNKLQ